MVSIILLIIIIIFIFVFAMFMFLMFSTSDNESTRRLQEKLHRILKYEPSIDIEDKTVETIDDVEEITTDNYKDQLRIDSHSYAVEKMCKELGNDFDAATLTCKYSKKVCEDSRNSLLDLMKNNPDKFDTLPEDEIPMYMQWDEENKKCFVIPSGTDIICNLYDFDYVKPKLTCIRKNNDTGECARWKIIKGNKCHIPNAYCKKKGMDYDSENHDCYTNDFQAGAEMILGKTVVRKYKQQIDDVATACSKGGESVENAALCNANIFLLIFTPLEMLIDIIGPDRFNAVGNFIDDDVGGFFKDDVKDAFNDVGDAFNDAGNAIADTAKDVGNATVDFFDSII